MKMTSLYIETFINGCIGDIWIFLFITKITNANLLLDHPKLNILSPLIPLVFISFTYIVGWIVHFLSEVILDPFFQSKFRDKYFSLKSLSFFKVKTIVYNYASNHTLDELEYDRHILRITKNNVLNFILISIAISLHLNDLNMLLIVLFDISVIFSIVLLKYWQNRYEGTFKKFVNIYEALASKDPSVKKYMQE